MVAWFRGHLGPGNVSGRTIRTYFGGLPGDPGALGPWDRPILGVVRVGDDAPVAQPIGRDSRRLFRDRVRSVGSQAGDLCPMSPADRRTGPDRAELMSAVGERGTEGEQREDRDETAVRTGRDTDARAHHGPVPQEQVS